MTASVQLSACSSDPVLRTSLGAQAEPNPDVIWADQREGLNRTRGDRTLRPSERPLVLNRTVLNRGVTPRIERNTLGQDEGADSVTVTLGAVHS